MIVCARSDPRTYRTARIVGLQLSNTINKGSNNITLIYGTKSIKPSPYPRLPLALPSLTFEVGWGAREHDPWKIFETADAQRCVLEHLESP